MANWNSKRDAEPDKKDLQKFKDFLINKYVNKRFSADSKADTDSDDSDQKAKKKAKKAKKDKKKRKVSSSSDPDDSDEQPVPVKVVEKKSRKLGAPPGFKAAPVAAAQP